MAEKVKLSKDGSSIDFVQSDSLPTSLKKFRQSPEIEGFYRFIFENDLQKEAYDILSRIIGARKEKKALEKAAQKAKEKEIKMAAKEAEKQKAAKIKMAEKAEKTAKAAAEAAAKAKAAAAAKAKAAAKSAKAAAKKPAKPAAKAKAAPAKKAKKNGKR